MAEIHIAGINLTLRGKFQRSPLSGRSTHRIGRLGENAILVNGNGRPVVVESVDYRHIGIGELHCEQQQVRWIVGLGNRCNPYP